MNTRPTHPSARTTAASARPLFLGSPIIAEARRKGQHAAIARQHGRLEPGSRRARGAEAELRDCCVRELRESALSLQIESFSRRRSRGRCDCHAGAPISRPCALKRRNDQKTMGQEAATFSSQGTSEMASIKDQRPSVISRSSSTTNASEDVAEAMLTDLVGSRVTTLARIRNVMSAWVTRLFLSGLAASHTGTVLVKTRR